jgi:hypothetical protein
LPQWQILLDRTIKGLRRLGAANQPVPNWVLGGGTALMIHTKHRISKDIDAFIDDPQYLPFLSPRLAGESVWACRRFDESPHHLKLVFPEGEVDFIVAASVTALPATRRNIDISDVEEGLSHMVDVEHPVETALKKLRYRGSMLTVRDIFDVSVVDNLFHDLLREHLSKVATLRTAMLTRMNGMTKTFVRRELNELEIAKNWRDHADLCFEHVRALVSAIPIH